jgi:hypothetical protein
MEKFEDEQMNGAGRVQVKTDPIRNESDFIFK